MKFEEVLLALKTGKKVRRKGFAGYIYADSGLFWLRREDDDYDNVFSLDADGVFADDWEIVDD